MTHDKIKARAITLLEELIQREPGRTAAHYARAASASVPRSVRTLRRWYASAMDDIEARLEEEEGEDGDEACLVDAGAPTGDRFDYHPDGYLIALRGEDEFTLPRDVVSDLCWFYSHHGGKRSAREATEILYMRKGVVLTEDYARRILRALGVLKTSPPFAPHLLERHTAEELNKINLKRLQDEAAHVLATNRARDYERLWKQAESRLASRDRVLEYLTERLAEKSASPIAKLPRVEWDERDILPVCAVYDVHCHKVGVDGKDSGTAHLRQAAAQMASRIRRMVGHPREIVVAFGGDFFHSDTPGKATTRGTPQDQHVSTAHAMWSGIDAAIDYIETMRGVAGGVRVVVVSGNHDEMLTWSLAKALELHYRRCVDVHIELQERTRAYLEHGQTLIGFEHGDGPKPGDLGSVMASEQREAWGRTKHAYWITGHLHHEKVIDRHGVTILQARSLAHADRWHHKNGYTTSSAGHDCYLFSAQEGKIGSLHV